MPEVTRPCSLAMNLFLIRLNEGKASNKYVYRYLKSKCGETQILAKLKGAATQTITKESVRSLQIPLLPRDIQDDFVSKLENVEVETQRLESLSQRKLAALDELKKSLLHQAFSGQL
jgi:type I restriction enzyme S subunit